MNIKYDQHDKCWQEILQGSSQSNVAQQWFDKNTLDYFRHISMVKPLQPLVDIGINDTWLTVGDGRYGLDAKKILDMGAKHVHATDFYDKLLAEGAKINAIPSFSQENAEDISFDNNSFDYVFCKESFHHFPRPFVALSEMFRVARKGVVLIEPRDMDIDRGTLFFVGNIIRFVLGRRVEKHAFESVGNYIYRLSEKEIEKFLLGVHHNHVAIKSINDVYFEGLEFVARPPVTNQDKYLTRNFRTKLFIHNMLEELKIQRSNMLIAILFKKQPEKELIEKLLIEKFKYRVLPRNPYL